MRPKLKVLNLLTREMVVINADMESIKEIDEQGTVRYKHPITKELYRIDGPAIEYSNGDKDWYLWDKRHRLDGPAIECIDGYKAWYVNGVRHRLDGPAIECIDGYKAWYVNGVRHRLDGPAAEWADRHKEWWLEGKRYSEEEWFRRKNAGEDTSNRLTNP